MRLPILLALIFTISGCATHSEWSHFSDGSLDSWLVREAVPEFSRVLVEHPRFRNETIYVAVVEGDQVQPRTDALSASLRDAVHARLLELPGLRLQLQDGVAQCTPAARGYLLGIEIQRGPRGGAQVQLRIYDNVEQRWVSGFSSQWRGVLSTAQLKLASRPAISEGARGQRVLPFDSGQSDLLAAYLADELACELKRRGIDELVVQPARHNAAALVAGNLAGRHRLAVARDGQLNLDIRVHEVNRGLYQVWAILTPHQGVETRSIAASAYARSPLLQRTIRASNYDTRQTYDDNGRR